MTRIPNFVNISKTKYDGHGYNEPSWYPENPYRVKRYRAYDVEAFNAGDHWAEIEPCWDKGRDVVLETIKNLPSAKKRSYKISQRKYGILVVIPKGNKWFPKGEYEKNMEKAKAQGYSGFLSLNTEYHTCWKEGFDTMLDTIKNLPTAKKVSGGTQVFIADDEKQVIKQMSRREEYEYCLKKGLL